MCDVCEQRGDHFEITADVPGFRKEDTTLEVHDGVLTISATKATETTNDEDKGGVKWHRVERSSGSLRRQIKLPATANLDAITAASQDGVLTVRVAKKPEAVETGPRRIAIA
jgi:HSP20 family protein